MDNLIFKDIILFSDIDGTLCTYDKKIPEKNLAAIERFKALGGRFSVCTGRSALSLRRAVDVLSLIHICCQQHLYYHSL